MSSMTNWSVGTSDGRYIGQAASFAPQNAFRDVMSVLGNRIAETELQVQLHQDGTVRIIYESKEFVVSSLGASRPQSRLE